MRTKLVIAAVAALLSTTAASAADLPIAPTKAPAQIASVAPSWTGFYMGANAGWASSGDDETLGGNNALSGILIATGAVPGTIADHGSGAVAGITGGYNWQQDAFVAGVEADWDWSGLKRSAGQTLSTGPLGFPASLAVSGERGSDWLGTFRARFGALVLGPSTLIYATGGLAFANVNGSTTAILSTPIPALRAGLTDTYSQSKLGWTVGGGVESKLNESWSWKAEYLFVDLGDHDGTVAGVVAGAPVSFSTHQSLNEQVFRAGVNYKLPAF